ncbi:MAG: hypothetical protein WKF70_03640 [Chitinophagaceae bacterium]
MDKLVSWKMAGDNEHQCPVCTMEKERSDNSELSCKGCCKDEVKQAKIEKNHKAEQNFLPEISSEAAVKTFNSNDVYHSISTKLSGSYNINGPPLKHKVPTFLFNCVFRI